MILFTGGGSGGCAIPACTAGGMPACLAAGLGGGGVVSQHAFQVFRPILKGESLGGSGQGGLQYHSQGGS